MHAFSIIPHHEYTKTSNRRRHGPLDYQTKVHPTSALLGLNGTWFRSNSIRRCYLIVREEKEEKLVRACVSGRVMH